MSIYPVPLQQWYPIRRKQEREERHNHENAKWIVTNSRCLSCGKHCKWNRAWGHHSLPYGYGDVWCSKECVWKPVKKLPAWKKARVTD